MESSPQVARRIVARGHVQGVWFRGSARQVAMRNGVTGWIVNRPDGAVEAWIEGTPDAVETVEAWFHAGGPPSAVVEDLDVEPVEPEEHEEFVILR